MDLKEFLLPSRSIEVAVTIVGDDHKPHVTRMKTVIETGYDNGFFKIIAPMYQGRLFTFREDDKLTVTFTTSNDQKKDAFDVNCLVVEREHKKGLYTVVLKITSEPQKVQRRQSFRVNIFNNYTFNYNGATCELVTKDISSTGMRGLTTMQMISNDTFEILFDGNTKERHEVDPEVYNLRVFPIKCRIIDCMPQTEIRRYMQRIQFVDMTSKQLQYLIQYLNSKQSEIIFTEAGDEKHQMLMDQVFSGQNDDRPIENAASRRIQLFGLLNLLFLFFAILFVLNAQPEPIYGLDRFFNYRRVQAWNSTYYVLSVVFTLITIFFGSFGLVLNADTLETTKDKMNKALIFTLISGIVLLLVLLVIFATQTVFMNNNVY